MKALRFFLLMFTLSLPAVSAEVVLEWDPNLEPEVTGYRAHWGTTTGTYTASKDVGKVTSTKIDGLVVGTTYYFVLTAYDIVGNESLPSNEVSWTPSPTPLTLAYDTKERKLEWADSRTTPLPPLLPFLYRIERTTVNNESDWTWTEQTELRSFAVADLQPGTYWFRVVPISRNGGGDLEPSNIVKVVILTPPTLRLKVVLQSSSDLKTWRDEIAFVEPIQEQKFFRAAAFIEDEP